MLEAEAFKRGYEPDEEGTFGSALAWPRVLDLFAGSGALGIEALSRGAQRADFVEQDSEAVRTIEANLRTTDLADRASVHRQSVGHALGQLRGPFDVVFLDPPYQEEGVGSKALGALVEKNLLMPTSVVVLEQSAASESPAQIGPLPLFRQKKHGKTRISLYALAPETDVEPEPPES
jgi:16S rRNA (guanine(966)-N(2))-methyltransferase RsmD